MLCVTGGVTGAKVLHCGVEAGATVLGADATVLGVATSPSTVASAPCTVAPASTPQKSTAAGD